MAHKGTLHVHLDRRGPVKLRETDYVTRGGEGSIYKTGTTIVKIYADPAKMVRAGMPQKLKALPSLPRVGIVAPLACRYSAGEPLPDTGASQSPVRSTGARPAACTSASRRVAGRGVAGLITRPISPRRPAARYASTARPWAKSR